jgi:hypothetical protein
MRSDEDLIREQFTFAVDKLPRVLKIYIANNEVPEAPETWTPNDPTIKMGQEYLYDNIKPSSVCWPLPDKYTVQNWQIINKPDGTRMLRLTYHDGDRSTINITVLRI